MNGVKSWKNRWETRVKSWFALLPVKINDEIRWLRRVSVLQYRLNGIGWQNYAFED